MASAQKYFKENKGKLDKKRELEAEMQLNAKESKNGVMGMTKLADQGNIKVDEAALVVSREGLNFVISSATAAIGGMLDQKLQSALGTTHMRVTSVEHQLQELREQNVMLVHMIQEQTKMLTAMAVKRYEVTTPLPTVAELNETVTTAEKRGTKVVKAVGKKTSKKTEKKPTAKKGTGRRVGRPSNAEKAAKAVVDQAIAEAAAGNENPTSEFHVPFNGKSYMWTKVDFDQAMSYMLGMAKEANIELDKGYAWQKLGGMHLSFYQYAMRSNKGMKWKDIVAEHMTKGAITEVIEEEVK